MRGLSARQRFGIFCVLALLVLGSLWQLQRSETPPWRQDSPNEPPVQSNPPKQTGNYDEAEPSPFRFVNYNVKNWLVSSQSPEKSAESKEAVISLIAGCEPDIVGLCEIGSDADLLEIQDKLAEAGVELPHRYHTGGADPVRHLGLLSRFPIISSMESSLGIPGTDRFIQRGILDATVSIGDAPVRFIGVHLKSKRVVPNYDEALHRLSEAQLVRTHIDAILNDNPSAKLIVYGDFNDHIRSLSTRTILGKYRTPLYLSPVSIKDSRGENWTHFYDAHDTYSRIDMIAVSAGLRTHINRSESRIVDHPDWQKASDHRPVLASFE